ncbi:MAG TPA: hypothetical protein VMU82_01160 [Acetobacteraceae bacterium]|nr:hypothetical protein [Acetobacteraceae bacterium]
MAPAGRIEPLPAPAASPLVLCDRLIRLAEEADRTGYRAAARKLVRMAWTLFDRNRR